MHDAVAWHPEQVTQALREGLSPRAVLARLQLREPSPRRRAGEASAERLARMEARLGSQGVRVLPFGRAGYPRLLEPLVDAPPILLVRGDPELLAEPGIALVGARAATRLGGRTARRLGRELSERGFVIVSGLARGIDADAHRGALEGSGRTIAVLACGPDRIYPPEHRRLADEILERGALLSEMPAGTPPRAAHFPLRNRLISGLSLAVIVVEARRRSGSLITVRHALNQGREVFVVPGSVEGPFAEGTNHLLREGARAIRHAEDVVEDLAGAGIEIARQTDASEADPEAARRRGGVAGRGDVASSGPARDSPAARAILAALASGPASRDELARRSLLGPSELAGALVELELSERVVRERDGRIHRRWR